MRRFYTSDPEKRLELVVERGYASKDTVDQLEEGLTLDRADQMIENAFGVYGIPYGLAFHFLINDKEYVVPMVTEEPSVIAAASGAAKTIKKAGGFDVTVHSRQMIGQVALMDIDEDDMPELESKIQAHSQELIAIANQAYPSIVKRGGGARSIQTKIIPTTDRQQAFLVVYLSVDTQEAMGANMLNTMLEALADELEEKTAATALMSILSNYATDSLVTASCRLPLADLNYKKIQGDELAKKIQAASELAQADVYRAATHNKGIMNGIDAVVIASGNDWRAVEAGAHAYAARDGHYRGLSQWYVDEKDLVGTITLPLAVGSVGGSIKLHPYAQASFEIMKVDSAKELSAVIASVGLAQNFAAIRALVSEGIQKGHMALQAKSLAIAVGAEKDEVPVVVRQLKQSKNMNQATAKEILEKLRQNS